MTCALKIAILLFLFVITDSTLSKSKKDKKRKEENFIFKSPVPFDDEYSLVNDNESIDSIINTHAKLDTDEKNYDGITFAYVTPWNNHGYDVVKWAAKKFTHISPVWFNIKFIDNNNKISVEISGKHDIDREWMNDILLNNSDIKFIPRFLFDDFDKKTYTAFLTNEKLQGIVINEIINFIKENNFDGAVLELWYQIYGRAENIEKYLIEIVEFFALQLKEANLISVLPLHPSLDSRLQNTQKISEDSLIRIGNSVDYINLMAYDYITDFNFFPISPIYWVEANINLLRDFVPEHKILLGLNWYGREFSLVNKHSKVILGKNFLDSIVNDDVQLFYDNFIKENQLVYLDEKKIIYYPTIKSLNERIKLADNYKLGGVAIWDVGQGLDHFTTVL